MSVRVFKPFLWLGCLVILVGLACNAANGTETPTEEPTVQLPAPTLPPIQATSPPQQPTELPPTREPLSTPTEIKPPPSIPTETVDSFALSEISYEHPNGLFQFNPPDGWSIENNSGSVSISAPDSSGFIYIQATNTGHTLDSTAFEAFITSREVNFFGTFNSYQETNRIIDGDFARANKTMVFNDVPQVVFTIYNQREQIIYAFDFWADADKAATYEPQYIALIDTLFFDGGVARGLDNYQWIYTFEGPAGLFTIEVPTAWKYERDVRDDNVVVVDTFYAPDSHAIIQNIGYDDGTPISNSVAGAFALDLLRTYYASDITITDDKVQSDGSERLTWHSKSGGYHGISFFESRGTTFLLFTIMWDDPYEDSYRPVLNYTVETYTIP